MSEHWRPGQKVVRGRFGRRQGSGRTGGSGTSWLSPDAYRALDPAARSELHFERAKQRHERQYRPTPARFRKGHYARQRMVWLAVVVGLGAAVTQQWPAIPDLASHNVASATAGTTGVMASFDLCHSGGGTNCVVDGDTFYVGGAKVRIAGIDAPETHPPRCAEEAQLGDAATAKLRALLNSGAVTMTSIERDRDGYGRLLRNVAVDGADVGAAMIGAGVARDYGGGRRSWC